MNVAIVNGFDYLITLLVLTLLLTVGFAIAATKVGLIDQPGGRKVHARPTPLVGGLAMYVALAAVVIGFGLLEIIPAPVLAAMGLLVAVGVLDDRFGTHVYYRFAAQIIAALILVFWGGIQVDSLGNLLGLGPIELGWLAVPFTVFAIVGFINAFNMLDGLDGLATSIGLVTTVAIGLLAYHAGQADLLQAALLLATLLIGFSLFNYRFPWRRQAIVFMGDAGSNSVGLLLAWLAISLLDRPNHELTPMSILWLLGFPVLDFLGVMWKRKRQGKSAFDPGRDHCHHELQRAGLGVNATVLTMAAMTALCSGTAVFSGWQPMPEPLLFAQFLAAAVIVYVIVTRLSTWTRPIRHLFTNASSQIAEGEG